MDMLRKYAKNTIQPNLIIMRIHTEKDYNLQGPQKVYIDPTYLSFMCGNLVGF